MPATTCTPARLDAIARRALEWTYAGAPAALFDNLDAAPEIYAAGMAGAYAGIAAALHTGDGADVDATARNGCAAALRPWTEDDAALDGAGA